LKKITCIAIEDEAPAIGLIQNYLKNFPGFTLKSHFVNAFAARDFLKNENIDVIFLDIQLPGISGMDFLRMLESPPLVIITSAYDEHAIEAFDLEVFDYLLKPYSLARFTQTIDRIERHFNPSDKETDEVITVKEGWEYRKFRFSELSYIESQKEYLIFRLSRGESHRTRMSMEEGMALFSPGKLLRIHRSFMVATNQIKAVTPREVILQTKSLPIGRSYQKKVLDFWRSE